MSQMKVTHKLYTTKQIPTNTMSDLYNERTSTIFTICIT